MCLGHLDIFILKFLTFNCFLYGKTCPLKFATSMLGITILSCSTYELIYRPLITCKFTNFNASLLISKS